MVSDSLPPSGSSTRTNGAPPAFDPLPSADLARLLAHLDQRLATVEQLLTHVAINQTNGQQQVMVKDVPMSFGAMVTFMVKWALAAVPAAIILLALWAFLALLFGSTLEVLLR